MIFEVLEWHAIMLNHRCRTLQRNAFPALNLFQKRFMKHWRPGLGLRIHQCWTRTSRLKPRILDLRQYLPGSHIIPQSYQSDRVVNFLIYFEENEQYGRKKKTGDPDLHTPTVCPCHSISRNTSNRNPYLCPFKDMYRNVQRSTTHNNPKVEMLPIPSMMEWIKCDIFLPWSTQQ